jgi:hypothetical protein
VAAGRSLEIGSPRANRASPMFFWLALIFASFSLFAPADPTVIVTLLVCALSVAGAIFLILALDQVFREPLRNPLAKLGQ